MEDNWNNEGGSIPPDEDYDDSGDREPRRPIAPDKSGGAELPIPVEEELVCCE